MDSFFRDGVDFSGIASSNLGDSHFFEDSDPPAALRSFLASSKETDKLRGMKHLLALLSQGGDISNYFPDVVKNVSAASVEVKKLVYIYLVHYADYNKTCREVALLSINSFQKDLAGGNQLIRGLALRVMTSIRVPDLIQIQILAIRKCSKDRSPYVRKCASVALTKVYALDRSQLPDLEEILSSLLEDASTMVLGSAVAAFNEICPQNLKLLHSSYRKLCQLLPDMDEWTQAPLLGVMTRYVRTFFTDPSRNHEGTKSTKVRGSRSNKRVVRRKVIKPAFYSDDENESEEEEIILDEESDSKPSRSEMGSVFTGVEADAELGANLDPDHALLLKTSISLLKSRNSSVVLAVCTLHHYCGPRTSVSSAQIGKALIRILKNNREIQYVVLQSIKTFAEEDPSMFAPYLSDFFVKLSDPLFNKLLKLEILAFLASPRNAETILKELQSYVRHSDVKFVCASVRAVGRVADAAPSFAGTSMEGLLHLLYCTVQDEVVDEAVMTLRQLLQQSVEYSENSVNIIYRLVKMLVGGDSDGNGAQVLKMPVARASVVWLVGESYDCLEKISPDILRMLASKFTDEDTMTKVQICNFAIKMGARLPEDEFVQSLMVYVLELARYDMDIDLRDRARFMTAMMGLTSIPSNDEGHTSPGDDTEALAEVSSHAAKILLSPKLPPVSVQSSALLEGVADFEIGSLSAIVAHNADGYVPIPTWSECQVDAAAREGSSSVESSLQRNGAEEDTDRFYGESVNHPKTPEVESSDSGDESSEYDTDATSSGSDEDEDGGDESDSSQNDSDESSDSSSDDMYVTATKVKTTPIVAGSTLGSLRRVDRHHHVSEKQLSQVADSSNKSGNELNSGKSDALLDFLPEDLHPSESRSQQASNGLHDILSKRNDMDFLDNPHQHDDHFEPNSDSTILSQLLESFPSQKISDSAFPQDSFQNVTASSSSASTMQQPFQDIYSVPKQVLKPELTSGLQVLLRFRHGATATQIPGSHCALLEVKNCNSDYSLRRIRPKFPGDLKVTPLEGISQLSPHQAVDIPLEIFLRGREGKPIKIIFSSDRGNFTGEVCFEKFELLFPLCLTVEEFAKSKKLLGGFSENRSTVSVSHNQSEEHQEAILKAILSRANLQVIRKESSGREMEWLLAGCYRKDFEEEKVLVTVTSSRASNSLSVNINADDAIMSATMCDYLKKSLNFL